MFKKYRHISVFTDDDNQLVGYYYLITDDDFEEKSLIFWKKFYYNLIPLHGAIIEFYSKKQLPIVPNLIRCMLWARDVFTWSLDDQVKMNKGFRYWQSVRQNGRTIEQDIKKYLLFS